MKKRAELTAARAVTSNALKWLLLGPDLIAVACRGSEWPENKQQSGDWGPWETVTCRRAPISALGNRDHCGG
ncbi:hypothetical protein NDU88_004782 [Pleurodeles waltl]|uniref:Uncharacterized protein n=1 Tax=Pleurodeles waltl TaxID=8319 RepID=A0AAV7NNA8_PLEWA|nr:hypothetical protein NDU88_004782 [Pleurodeles waltl]